MGQITRTNYGLVKTNTFTNAQVIAWPTTALTLVAGIAGRIWLPRSIVFSLDPWVANYTNVNVAAAFAPVISSGVAVFWVTMNKAVIDSILSGGVAITYMNTILNIPVATSTVLGGDITLTFSNGGAGNLTGGNVGN